MTGEHSLPQLLLCPPSSPTYRWTSRPCNSRRVRPPLPMRALLQAAACLQRVPSRSVAVNRSLVSPWSSVLRRQVLSSPRRSCAAPCVPPQSHRQSCLVDSRKPSSLLPPRPGSLAVYVARSERLPASRRHPSARTPAFTETKHGAAVPPMEDSCRTRSRFPA